MQREGTMSTNRRNTRGSIIEASAVAGSRRASHFVPRGGSASDGKGATGQAKTSGEENTIERILHAADPNIRSTPVYFDYRKDARMYKFVPSVNHTAVHFSLSGLAIRKESAEAAAQQEERERRQHEMEAAAQAELNPELVEAGVSTKILKNQFNYSDRGSQTMNRPLRERVLLTDPPPTISFGGRATAWAIYDAYEADRLQSERMTQKKALVAKHEAGAARAMNVNTGQSHSGSSSGGGGGGNANTRRHTGVAGGGGGGPNAHGLEEDGWLSHGGDGGGGPRGGGGTGREEEGGCVGGPVGSDVFQSTRFGHALKIMERMVNQNDCFDIIDDFKFWEDKSDLYKEEGTLLPLWQFFAEGTHRRTVTCIALNPRYSDFFAVGYGSYEFQKAHKGVIHCFTLKNAVPNENNISAPAHPEFTFRTESGVLCLAFHPAESSSLLACGLSNGVVCVYDLRIKDEKQRSRPIYRSNIRTGVHTDPVWEIYWSGTGHVGRDTAQSDHPPGTTTTTTTTTTNGNNNDYNNDSAAVELSFYSISTDGDIMQWVMYKKELTSKRVLRLHVGACTAESEAMALGRLSGTCMDYSPHHDKLVVGTQEGQVQLYNFSHHVQCVERYEGHTMAVYTVRWNRFHHNIFLTCSADWTVKLWLRTSVKPLLTFDLGDSVGDVAWAPNSATVFAAVTNNGKVYVFDLDVKKTEPLCVQTVIKNAKLTHVVFSHVDPILYVGDTRGTVLTLKLSPNLRRVTKPTKKDVEQGVTPYQMEVRKMTQLIHVTMKNRTLLNNE